MKRLYMMEKAECVRGRAQVVLNTCSLVSYHGSLKPKQQHLKRLFTKNEHVILNCTQRPGVSMHISFLGKKTKKHQKKPQTPTNFL